MTVAMVALGVLLLAQSPLAMRITYPVPEAVRGTTKFGGHEVSYAVMGERDAPPVLLVHGFGASKYHWRYNMPVLADAGYRVVAVDLLGFGDSEKPLIDYTPSLWLNQCAELLESDVVGCGGSRKAVVCGNSLGGYVSLALASERPDLIKGCVLLNVAGRFSASDGAANPNEATDGGSGGADGGGGALENLREAVGKLIQRAVLTSSFYFTKQPARIEQVLRQVYSVSDANVDQDLVESIRAPSDDANAAEVFYRIVSRTATGPLAAGDTIDGRLRLLEDDMPLLLLWGQQDPWIRPPVADKIQALRPQTQRVNLAAGHCPMDELPAETNDALLNFLRQG